MKNEIIDIEPASIQTIVDINPIFQDWLDYLRLNVSAGAMSPDTAASYDRGATKFIKFLKGRQFSQDEILEWMSELRSAGKKPATVNAWLSGVRAFFGWATTKAQINFNPSQGIRGAKRSGTKKRHVREAFTDAEVRALLAQPNRETDAGKRDYALLIIQLYTAGRGIEFYRANISDIKTENGRTVLYIQGKGHEDKEEPLILQPAAEEALRDWLGAHPDKSDPLFCSMSQRSYGERLSRSATRAIIHGYIKAAGIVGHKSTHSLRHTAITNAIRHGVPIQRVSKQLARHASIDTTMIYVHEADRMSDPVEDHIIYDEA
jgi:site-specific recombinase XerD